MTSPYLETDIQRGEAALAEGRTVLVSWYCGITNRDRARAFWSVADRDGGFASALRQLAVLSHVRYLDVTPARLA